MNAFQQSDSWVNSFTQQSALADPNLSSVVGNSSSAYTNNCTTNENDNTAYVTSKSTATTTTTTPSPSSNVDELESILHCSWNGGASTGLSRRNSFANLLRDIQILQTPTLFDHQSQSSSISPVLESVEDNMDTAIDTSGAPDSEEISRAELMLYQMEECKHQLPQKATKTPTTKAKKSSPVMVAVVPTPINVANFNRINTSSANTVTTNTTTNGNAAYRTLSPSAGVRTASPAGKKSSASSIKRSNSLGTTKPRKIKMEALVSPTQIVRPASSEPINAFLPADKAQILTRDHKPARGRGRTAQLQRMSREQIEAEADARVEKNRQAARECRARRKQQVGELRQCVEDLEHRNATSQCHIEQLQQQQHRSLSTISAMAQTIRQLELELKQQELSKSTAGFSTPPSTPPSTTIIC